MSRAKSAGRVQSPTLRILCEKEDERDLHIAEEYWPFESSFDFSGTSFDAKLTQIFERSINKEPLKDEQEVNNLIKEYCLNNENLFYVETADLFLNDNGTPNNKLFLKDLLHLNKKGYMIWDKVVKDRIELIFKK